MKIKLAGIGIDLVNLLRIRKFVRQHSSNNLRRLLSVSEQRRFGKKKISPQTFAKIFTAKEAFFKTLNRPWMGLQGFHAMSVVFKKADTFEISMNAALNSKRPLRADGCFFCTGNLWGAQVVRWK